MTPMAKPEPLCLAQAMARVNAVRASNLEGFGDTADYHQAAGEHTRDTRWVAGIRVWF